MENLCDICGNVGVEEALVRCSRCNSSCEHKYCRKIPVEMDFVDWCCETCEPIPAAAAAASGLTEIIPESSKPTQPMKLYSGASLRRRGAKKGCGASVNWEKKVASGKTKYISAEEAILLSSGAKKSSPPCKIAGLSLPPRPRNIASGFEQRLSSPPQTARTPLMQKKNTVDVNLAQTKGKTVMMKTLLASAPSVSISICNDENANVNIFPDMEKCIPNSNSLWKGSFNIQDVSTHGKLNPKIQAHPPCIVRKKVHDLSKKMPGLLSFELVPCVKVLPPDYIPDRKDIGLYFFPRDFEKTKDYISMMNSICEKNLALKFQIAADLELLVFTSELLNNQCRYWEGYRYLWGTFRRLNDISRLTVVSGLEEEVDMDIDMIGGVTVGNCDVAVPREKSDYPPGFEDKWKQVDINS